MTTPVTNIIRCARGKHEKLNILCFFLDGVFEETLLQTGHRFYGSEASYSALTIIPNENLYVLPDTFDKIPKDVNFDIVLCNHRESHLQSARILSDSLHIPLVTIEHTGASTKLVEKCQNTIYTSKLVQDKYDGGFLKTMIPYGAEVIKSKEERNIDLFIYGKFTNTDKGLIQYLQTLNFTTKIGGNNPGISENMSFEKIKENMLQSKVFLNLSYPNFTSSLLLHAMGCGCVVVSNKTELTEHFITHGKTGFIEKELEKFSSVINQAIDNREKLSINTQKYIKDNHEMNNIVQQWSKTLFDISQQVYIR